MARQVRLVIIAAVCVALLALATVLLQTETETQESTVTVFRESPPTDVLNVRVKNTYGSFSVVFESDGYLVDDIPAELVHMNHFIELMTYSGAIQTLQTVELQPDDISLFGLDSPSARIEIDYYGGDRITLLLGNSERVSGNYYCSVEGDPAVYLIAADRCIPFLMPKTSYIENLITPQHASPLSVILDVTFSGGPLPEPVTINAVSKDNPEMMRKATSFGTATHIVQRRGIYQLDQTYGLELLGSLLGIKAINIEGYLLTPDQIAEFGFADPDMQVEFDFKPAPDAQTTRYTLSLIDMNGRYFMTCNDNGVIYEVAEPFFYTLEYDKLLLRWFLSPLLMDVAQITLTTGGQTLDFVLTGDSNADKEVTCNGSELSIERFRTFFRLLISAAHDGSVIDGVEPDSEPLMTLTYHYLDKDKQPDVLSLYKGDMRRLLVQINGVTEVTMREMYLTRVQEAIGALWTDQPIEITW